MTAKKTRKTTTNLANVIASLPGHVYWLDRNNVFLGCNDLQAKTIGLSSRHEIVGRTISEFQTKENAEHILRINHLVMTTGKSQIAEEPYLRSDGEIIIFLSHKYPLRDKKGKIIGTIGISLDVTDIKQREQSLDLLQKQTQLTLQNIVSSLPGHVYWKNKQGVYLGCNDAQAESLGLKSHKDMIGKTDYDLSPKNLADIYKKIDLEIMKNRKEEIIEEPTIYHGKSGVFLSHKRPMLDNVGNVIGILGISLDVTDRKETEKKLHESKIKEKIQEEKIETMQTLGGSIAHELRTPLNSINSANNNILVHLPALIEAYELATKHNLPVKKIRSWHMDLLKNTVNNITKELSFSNTIIDMLLMNIRGIQPDSNTSELCSATICIKNALERYPFADGEKKLVSFKESKDFIFKGNTLMIVHVLFNLIKNALYYLAKAQKGEIVIWLEHDKKENTLHFKDTGSGISQDMRPKIFEHFFSETYGGTGVGLSFCKMVMNNLGGKITCNSQKDEFTEFVLIFPKV